MANRTPKYVRTVHGTNPQYLIEKIRRDRIYESKYWQEECFMLTSALVLERAVDDLKYIGGSYGSNNSPTPFLCLVLKLLQIQPMKEIIYLYIEQKDFKYLRAVGAFYLRLVGTPIEVYTKLEPLFSDYRKLRVIDSQRNFSILHMDEFIDNLLREEKIFNLSMPRITKRIVLEENKEISPYKSELEEQNLIPTQLIEETVERQRSAERRQHTKEDFSRHPRHKYDSYDRSLDRPKATHITKETAERRRDHDRYAPSGGSHHPTHRRYESSRGDDRRDHGRIRDADTSPSHRHDKERPSSNRSHGASKPDVRTSSYGRESGKITQAMIDHENSIRAKLGLKPLK